MYTVTKAYVTGQLVQFGIDRDLSGIGAGVGQQRQTIARGHHRIGNHKITIEEELQNGNASTAHCSVTGGIGWMSRRTLRKRLGEEVRPVLAEALGYRLRVQNVGVWHSLERGAGDRLVDQSSTPLGTMGEVHQPLLVPHLVQRTGGNFSHRGREVRTAEC